MFGEVVRVHRRRMGLTQEELAEKAGVSARTIGNIEAERIAAPRPSTVRLLALVFGLSGKEYDEFCGTAHSSAESPEGPSVPRQLPAVTPHFAGRSAELDRLETLLSEAGSGRAFVITSIAGTAGIGKTTLALRWAHRAADRFADGQLYVNLRGFSESGDHVTASEALYGFLEALDVPAHRIPATLDVRSRSFAP